jgi:hypothetical protein
MRRVVIALAGSCAVYDATLLLPKLDGGVDASGVDAPDERHWCEKQDAFFCADFDEGDALAGFGSFENSSDAATLTLDPLATSPPNSALIFLPANTPADTFAALDRFFPQFRKSHFEADVRIATGSYPQTDFLSNRGSSACFTADCSCEARAPKRRSFRRTCCPTAVSLRIPSRFPARFCLRRGHTSLSTSISTRRTTRTRSAKLLAAVRHQPDVRHAFDAADIRSIGVSNAARERGERRDPLRQRRLRLRAVDFNC